jgi:carbamoyl-phosphate synthase large subunit
MTKVLMTGAGAPGAPGIIKSLLADSSIDLVVCDADEHATGRYLARSFIQVPQADHPDFIREVETIAQNQQIEVIFPLVTKELPLFSSAKKRFEELNIKIIVSDEGPLRIANNKGLLYTYLQQQSIHVPAFEIVDSINKLNTTLEKLGYPLNPVCIKPTVSNGSRGFRILDEHIDQYELFFNQKPNNTYATLQQINNILEGKPFIELLVSEYLPGEEYTVDCIADKGESKVILPRRRTKMLEGISVKGVFEQHDEIIDYCRKIISSLKLDGPIGIQVKKDINGTFQILEINPRIQGTSVAALGIGINLSLMAVQHALGTPITIDNKNIQWGTHFSRYWDEVFYS